MMTERFLIFWHKHGKKMSVNSSLLPHIQASAFESQGSSQQCISNAHTTTWNAHMSVLAQARRLD